MAKIWEDDQIAAAKEQNLWLCKVILDGRYASDGQYKQTVSRPISKERYSEMWNLLLKWQKEDRKELETKEHANKSA